MSNLALFLFGMLVFALMFTGLMLSMAEFRRVTTRPDLLVGASSRNAAEPGARVAEKHARGSAGR